MRRKKRRRRRGGPRAPELDVAQILAWIDAYHARTNRWPRRDSGPIPESIRETWFKVDKALRYGHRGLPGGSSLVELLVERRGLRNNWHLPPLTVGQILAWAKAFLERHGRWPTARPEPIPEAPEETWEGVDAALRKGRRTLPGGSSLARLRALAHARHEAGAVDRAEGDETTQSASPSLGRSPRRFVDFQEK